MASLVSKSVRKMKAAYPSLNLANLGTVKLMSTLHDTVIIKSLFRFAILKPYSRIFKPTHPHLPAFPPSCLRRICQSELFRMISKLIIVVPVSLKKVPVPAPKKQPPGGVQTHSNFDRNMLLIQLIENFIVQLLEGQKIDYVVNN